MENFKHSPMATELEVAGPTPAPSGVCMHLDSTPGTASEIPPSTTSPPSFTRVSKILPGQLLCPRLLAFMVSPSGGGRESMSWHWAAATTQDGASRARPGSEDTAPACTGGRFVWDQRGLVLASRSPRLHLTATTSV